MNKANKILNLTEAFMATEFVKAVQQASSNLGTLYKSLNASINSVEIMLQEPVDEKNINKVDRALKGLDSRLENFEKSLNNLQFRLAELRGEIARYAQKEVAGGGDEQS